MYIIISYKLICYGFFMHLKVQGQGRHNSTGEIGKGRTTITGSLGRKVTVKKNSIVPTKIIFILIGWALFTGLLAGLHAANIPYAASYIKMAGIASGVIEVMSIVGIGIWYCVESRRNNKYAKEKSARPIKKTPGKDKGKEKAEPKKHARGARHSARRERFFGPSGSDSEESDY